MNYKRAAVIFLGLVWFLLSAMTGLAQMKAIRGRVVDQNDAPLKDVQIEIQRTDVKGNYKTKTDKKGEYYHGGLPLGVFIIRAKKEGFRPEENQGVRLAGAEEREINFKMQPGSGRLASELSKEELERMKKEAEAAQKQQEVAGELKGLVEAANELSRKGQHGEAIEQYKKALEKDPKQPYILARLADSYAKNKQVNEAIETFKKAIELKPAEAAFHQNLAIAYAMARNFKEADEELKKASAIDPTMAAQNAYNMGAILMNNGKAEEAVAAFENTIKIDPNYAEAYFQLATAQLGANKIDLAVKNLKKYQEIGKNPQNLQVTKDLLVALEKK